AWTWEAPLRCVAAIRPMPDGARSTRRSPRPAQGGEDGRRLPDAMLRASVFPGNRPDAQQTREGTPAPGRAQDPERGAGPSGVAPAVGSGGRYGLVQVRVGTVLVPFCVPLNPNWVVAFAARFPL